MAQVQFLLNEADLAELSEDQISDLEVETIKNIDTDSILEKIDFCQTYRSQIRVPLRKVRNTLKKLQFIPFLGSKPYELISAIMEVLDRICPE